MAEYSAETQAYLMKLGIDSGIYDQDPSLQILEHIVQSISVLKNVNDIKKLQYSAPSLTYGLYLQKQLSNCLGKSLSQIVTNDFSREDSVVNKAVECDLETNSTEEAIEGYHKLCDSILYKFPEFGTVKGNKGDKTLLHHAAFKSHAKVIPEMDPSAKLSEEEFAAVAKSGKNVTNRAFKTLLQYHEDGAKEKDNLGALPLHWATRNKNMDVESLATLIQANPAGPATQDKSGYLPLHWAVCQDEPSPEIVKALIDAHPKGVKMMCNEKSLPLHWSVNREKPNIEVVRSLLVADPNSSSKTDKDGWLPLHRCVDRSNPDIETVRMLMSSYPEALEMTNAEGHLPLHLSLDHDMPSAEVVRLLVSTNPAAASVVDFHGYLPLHTCLDNPHPDYHVAELMLEANPRAAEFQTTEGLFPIHIVAQTNMDPSPHFVTELLKLNPHAVRVEVEDSVPDDDSWVNEGNSIHLWRGAWREARWTPFSRATDRGLTKIVPLLRNARFKAIAAQGGGGGRSPSQSSIPMSPSKGATLRPDRSLSPDGLGQGSVNDNEIGMGKDLDHPAFAAANPSTKSQSFNKYKPTQDV